MIATGTSSVESLAAGGLPFNTDQDQRILLHRVSWGRYVIIRELLEDSPGLRITYLKGALEIMSPSTGHERIKTMLARLLEFWAVERGVELQGFGSATYRKEAEERGLEPDECYYVGDTTRPFPDLAIEVELSRSAIDKLEVYRGLEVPEVWIWREDRIQVYCLRAGHYERLERSALLPEFDLDLAVDLILQNTAQSATVRAFRDRIREGK